MTNPTRTLALIAHDGKKQEMIEFALGQLDRLSLFSLVGTATTADLLLTSHEL